ncbi:MAG: hypothetical protein CL912_25560 [Deltaproteobacteria bacterium]|uniref:Uncharacterized protein n=1 Tax=Cadophora malorum TaxID=108018 RepID=A0A8H7WEU4_9HELO|nr:hypothetical protein IFR04_003313 [Cadophora malorum]MAD86339.1 hypothetical protein [Deltaproteobacteria bacterium]
MSSIQNSAVDNHIPPRPFTLVALEEVEVYAAALSYLMADYNILVIGFDKDRDNNIRNTYASLGLDCMVRIFDVEDHIQLEEFIY